MKYNHYAQKIKDRVSVRDVCELYGVAISPAGFCRCPFHSEKTASCKVNYKDGGYHCFGCGAHGDVIDFVGRLFDLGFTDAEKKINTDFGLGIPLQVSDKDLRKQEAISRIIRLQNAGRTRERDRLFTEYLNALERWIKLDRAMRIGKPKNPDDYNYAYCYACNHIEQAKYEAQCADIRLCEFEKRERNRRHATVTDTSVHR